MAKYVKRKESKMIIFPDIDLRFWEVSNAATSPSSEDYYNKAQIDSKLRTLSGNLESDIDEATSGKQDTLVSGVNIKTINQQSILGEGDIEISGGVADAYTKAETDQLLAQKAYVSSLTATNTALENHVSDNDIHVTISDKQAWNNKLDASAITAYSTSQEVATAIETATSGLASTSAITATYYDKTTIDARDGAVAQALIDLNANKQDVLESGVTIKTINSISLLGSGNIEISGSSVDAYTKAETDALLSGKADSSALTAYSTTQEVATAIETAVSGKADSSAVTADINAAVSGKQDTLISGTNIKTINSISLLGSGNIEITSGGPVDCYTRAETDALLSGKADSSALTAYSTSQEVATAIETATSGKADSSAVTVEISAAVSGKLDSSAITAYSTTQEVATAIETATSGKADSSSVTTVSNALTSHTSNTDVHTSAAEKQTWNAKADVSAITAAVSGKCDTSALTAYSTSQEVSTAIETATSGKCDTSALTAYSTTQQMNTAIDAATSGKSDTSATTAVNNALTGHTGDSTIHVTSSDKTAWNGAATNASAAVGQLNGFTIVSMSKSDYDLLPTKDPNTIYFLTT